MYAEVKFKDFRKAVIPKFDAGKRDSFVHWYKLFCSTCLQWGIWCPPYESAKEDEVHGAWWRLLPESVRQADRFMAGLIYSALILESTFPVGSEEQNAVEGCPPPTLDIMPFTRYSVFIILCSIRSCPLPTKSLDNTATNRSVCIFVVSKISWFVNAWLPARTPSPKRLI